MPTDCSEKQPRRISIRVRSGFTIIEMVTTLCVVLCLVSVLVSAPLATVRIQNDYVKDGVNLSQISKSMSTYASDQDGIFPTPGLIQRKQYNGAWVPGRGEEDYGSNSHDNLYSALIQQNFVSPEILISNGETSRNVQVDSDYDYEAYRPLRGIFWDSSFKANLESECNISFATLLLAGERKKAQWRDALDSSFALFGTRSDESEKGFSEGRNIASARHSNTHAMYAPHDRWTGLLCFSDGHVEAVDRASAISSHATWSSASGTFADDPFLNEDRSNGRDSFLCIVRVSVDRPDDLDGYIATWD